MREYIAGLSIGFIVGTLVCIVVDDFSLANSVKNQRLVFNGVVYTLAPLPVQ